MVATPSAFTDAAAGNQAIAAIQPGFYKLRTKIAGKEAVARLAEQDNRVGLLVIPEGRQLDDVSAVSNGAVTEGIFTLIARASCVDLDGDKHCVAASDLRQAATTASQGELDVPDWASNGVNAVRDDHRRIEGLIAAGRWDFDPMAEPEQILASLIRESNAQYQQLGLLSLMRPGCRPIRCWWWRPCCNARPSPGFREGGAGRLQPSCQTSEARIRLHRELPVGPAGSRDHRRRS